MNIFKEAANIYRATLNGGSFEMKLDRWIEKVCDKLWHELN